MTHHILITIIKKNKTAKRRVLRVRVQFKIGVSQRLTGYFEQRADGNEG